MSLRTASALVFFASICLSATADAQMTRYVDIAEGQCIPSETAKLTASNADMNDRFGSSVAMIADIAVIAAPFEANCGAAYVFRFHNGQWTEEEKLVGSNDVVCDGFGRSVGISGDVIVVGAHNDNEACQPPDDDDCRAGAAYVYRFNGTNWVEEDKLIASDAAAQDRFGSFVAISENVIVVSARDDDDACPGDPQCNSGSAYVFRFDGGDWIEEAKLTSPDAAPDDGFSVVAVQGDVIVVGAFNDDGACPGDPECNSGSAYVFRFDGGDWVEEAKLTASDAEQGDIFGFPISISGDVVAIGAPHDDDACPGDPECDSGSAYVFRFDGGDWVEEAKLTASDAGQEDLFGAATFLAGNLILEGARFAGVGGQAYLYRFDGSEWIEQAIISTSDSDHGDQFGRAISASNDMALIGAMQHDDFAGAVYVFNNLDGACDDGDACTENDQCIDGVCTGPPIGCDDGDECTDDSCDPEVGCTHDDINCSDGNPCTNDLCDPDTGCAHEDIECPEGQACDPVSGECVVDQDPCECANGRVTLCHIPSGNLANARTITVGCAARDWHLAHGDTCGPCE